MNDSMSILLATTILALGGLGLYMYKTTDNKEEHYDEESSMNFFNWGRKDGDESEDDLDGKNDELEDLYYEDVKPRRKNTKTARNRKSTGTSRRKY